MAARRLRLRLFDELSPQRATPDALRDKLGGRAAVSDGSVGDVVQVRGREAGEPGVVLYADAETSHVWVGDGIVRRVPRGELTLHDGATPLGIARVAETARLFAELVEGDRVSFVDAEGKAHHGELVEKHRFGGLVAASDGKVTAVGFRRLARDEQRDPSLS